MHDTLKSIFIKLNVKILKEGKECHLLRIFGFFNFHLWEEELLPMAYKKIQSIASEMYQFLMQTEAHANMLKV